ncbi:MAG: hypothetical protein JWO32_616 [Bacteroidetes bacterium]|nr:hypothetical protein [Bacteroidota bacterium]
MLLFLLTFSVPSQIAPGIEWRKCTWSPKGLNGQTQTAEQSGEEWWYSHKNVYDATGTHTAYVTCGYTSLVSTIGTFSAAQLVYNEGPDSPYNPITTESYDYYTLAEGCADRDYVGEHRTPPRGNIGLNDLEGNMIYCRPKTIGALEEVIQDPDELTSFYVVGMHLGVKPFKNKINFLRYNPGPANPADYFSLPALGVTNYTTSYGHMYVAKIDVSGVVIWEGLYGIPDYSLSPLQAYESEGYGYDIIKNSSGHLVVAGMSHPNNSPTKEASPALLELDPTTGYVIKKGWLDVDEPGMGPLSNYHSGTVSFGVAHSLVEIGASQIYAVAVNSFFDSTDTRDRNNAFVWAVDSNFNPSPGWATNPIRFPGNGAMYYNSNIWEIKYHKALKQLLVPVVRDCETCIWAGYNSGQGYIYRLDSAGILIKEGTNPSPMGPVNAYDLRIGVEETSDKGFVAVSSVRPPSADHSFPTSTELGYLASCPELDMNDWDTDALVVKYDSQGKTEWSKTFDREDNGPRVPPPGDLKRQECMYKITQAQDGGYVISGNASGNFDDNYMAKLYNDCNARHTYTVGAENEIHLTSNTTWNNSVNVAGKIIVHPGVTFRVEGNSIVRFADSKLTGIETNVTVMYGGALQVAPGSTLTSIDPAICQNSKWDGVKIIGDETAENKLVIFPNPATSSFKLIYNGVEGTQFDYIIMDVLGNEILNGRLNSDFTGEINSALLQPGVYFINLYLDKKIAGKQKLVIVK